MSQNRILVLSPWGLGGGYSGPLTLLDRLATELSASGYRIDVAYRNRGAEDPRPWATATFELGSSSRFGRAEQIRWGLAARRLIAERGSEYAAIHLHGFYLANQIAIAGYDGGAAVVALPVLDGGDLGNPQQDSRWHPKSVAIRAAARAVDAGLALSNGIADSFVYLGVQRDHISLVGNPANPAAFEVGAARSSRCPDPIVGFVGKVGGFKNPELLVRSIAFLRQRGLAARGLFVGPFDSDDTRSRMHSLVEQEELVDAIEFTGFTEDVATHLARMDVFALPSAKEGLPGALCEAMAAALPCVVTDVGSMATHVGAADCGLVVDSTVASLAAGLERALGDRWEHYSQSAHEYARENFSPSTILIAYEVVISKSK